MVQFLKVAVFGKTLDPHFKTILKGGTNIEDVMLSQKVADLVSEILLKLEAEISPGKVKESVLAADDDEDPETKVSLESLVDSELLEDEENAKELQEHLRAVKEYAGRFITFRPFEQSVLKTQQLLEGTVLQKFPVRGKYWCVWYDTKTQGESSAQPHCRCPPYQKATFKKHVHAAFQARGETEITEETLVMCMDGFRSLEAQFSKDLVLPSGDVMMKSRNTFQVAYDEKALRTRKCLTRGMVSQVEGLHVYSKEGLALTDRERKTYVGSTHGSLIGPVVVSPFRGGFLVSKECKEKMLGENGKVLAGGPCQGQGSLPGDIEDMLPASFYSLPTAFYIEMIHSFELGGVYDSTCMDVNFALACLKSKVPYIGSCLSEYACEVLEAEVVRACWKEFLTPESELYDVNLHKLVDAQGTQGVKGAKGGKGKKGGKKGTKKGDGKGDGEDPEPEEPGQGTKGGGKPGKGSKGGKGGKGNTEASIMQALASLGNQ